MGGIFSILKSPASGKEIRPVSRESGFWTCACLARDLRAFRNFKLKVFKYRRNFRLQATLMLKVLKNPQLAKYCKEPEAPYE